MKCPGQDSRYWKPGAIFEARCPECGNEVEFFKDDTTRICKKCGHRFLNPALDFGCASYCKYAEQCIGNLPPELIAQKEDLLKDRIAVEMKRYLHRDFKRIGHAMRVARYAEEIAREEGGNLAVVLPAAYLHDIGIKAAEEKYGESAWDHHEEMGASVAREILEGLGARKELIEEVCGIVSRHHHPREEGESPEFNSVYDADVIVNLEEKGRGSAEGALLTKSGRGLAGRIRSAGPEGGDDEI